jgi:hypothetical protein
MRIRRDTWLRLNSPKFLTEVLALDNGERLPLVPRALISDIATVIKSVKEDLQ